MKLDSRKMPHPHVAHMRIQETLLCRIRLRTSPLGKAAQKPLTIWTINTTLPILDKGSLELIFHSAD